MNLVPWRNKKQTGEILPQVSNLRTEMDKLFERFLGDSFPAFPSDGWSSMTSFNPSLDVSENEKEILVRLEIPGVDPKDLDISLSGNVLTVAGEKKEEKEDKGRDFYHSERRYGSFRRSVELPETADLESINAEHAAGMLKIHVAKTAGSAPKKISVQTR